MKLKNHLAWLFFSLVLMAVLQVEGADEVRVSYPSKVDAGKRKEREKLLSKWMNTQDILVHDEQMVKQGQQLIYFEFDGARNMWRTISTSKIRLNGPWSWWGFVDEKEMETKLNNEIKLGRQPAFLARDNGGYAMFFVSPGDMDAVRKELTALGVGEPKLKK